MKKLILLLSGILLSGFMIGQSLSLSDDQGTPLTAGQTFYVLGDPSVGTQLHLIIHVTNNSGNYVVTKVKRTEDNVIAGVTDEFCWAGACFPPGSAQSFLSDTIFPGLTNTSFEAKYTHNNQYGESQYTYTWFDVNNPTDEVSVVVVYKLTGVGISEDLNNVSISQAYPNPANTYVFFDFEIPSTTENSSIVITNILGAVVKEIPATGNTGKVKINISDLDNGLYFGSLKVGNQIASTRRFVVNH